MSQAAYDRNQLGRYLRNGLGCTEVVQHLEADRVDMGKIKLVIVFPPLFVLRILVLAVLNCCVVPCSTA